MLTLVSRSMRWCEARVSSASPWQTSPATGDIARRGRRPYAFPVSIDVTWLGHSTVVVDIDGVRIVADPLLRRHAGVLRRRGRRPDPAAWAGPDAVLLSHLHLDHAEVRSLRLLGDAPVLTAPENAAWATAKGLNGQPLAPDEWVPVGTPNAGSGCVWCPPCTTPRPMPHRPNPANGHLVQGPSGTVWVAGDTELYPDMELLPTWAGAPIDVALVPIAGWGPRLSAGHMGPEEAAVACRRIGARWAVPVHWNTFYVPTTDMWPGDWMAAPGTEVRDRARPRGTRVPSPRPGPGRVRDHPPDGRRSDGHPAGVMLRPRGSRRVRGMTETAAVGRLWADDERARLLDLVDQVDSIELKTSVADADRRSAVAALDLDPLAADLVQVWFFDTPGLDLNAAGVIIRARRTRSPRRHHGQAASGRARRAAGGPAGPSPGSGWRSTRCRPASCARRRLKRKLEPGTVREALLGGKPPRKLFSKSQRAFFEQFAPAGLSLDDVRPLGPITVLKLNFTPKGFDRRMVAELWTYPDGSRILELSTKCEPAEAFDVAASTRAFLEGRGIDLSGVQQTKTKTALDYFAGELRDQEGDDS